MCSLVRLAANARKSSQLLLTARTPKCVKCKPLANRASAQKNCKWGLVRQWTHEGESPIDAVSCPMVDAKGSIAKVDAGVMSPHKVVTILQSKCPEQLKRHTSHRTVAEFWNEHDMNDPSFYNHPMTDGSRPLWRQQAHGIAVHCDKVRLTSTTSLMVSSWGVTQSLGSTMMQAFLLWILSSVPAWWGG